MLVLAFLYTFELGIKGASAKVDVVKHPGVHRHVHNPEKLEVKHAADGVEKLLELVLLGLAITALGEGLEQHKIRGEEEVWEPLPLPLQAVSAKPC